MAAMINSRMRTYDYYLLGNKDNYGQTTIITNDSGQPVIQGQVSLSISLITQALSNNIRYSDATYIGLTTDKDINDTYIIKYEDELLKVKYVNREGRFSQVYMGLFK